VSGRVTLVTGAAGGIGRALAGRLAAAGDRLVLTDAAAGPLADVAPALGEGRALRRALDVRDPAAWEAVVAEARARFGRLDVLIQSAGVLRPARFHEAALDDVVRQLDVNARGVALGTRVAAAAMVEQGAGHVVNVASMAALAPIPGLACYSASKYAVRALSLAAADELRPYGVAVTVVCPDAVQTPMLAAQVGEAAAALTFSGPRILSPDEVARAIVERALVRRPLELWLPRRRGVLARFADVVPRVGFRLGGGLRRRGLARMERLKGR